MTILVEAAAEDLAAVVSVTHVAHEVADHMSSLSSSYYNRIPLWAQLSINISFFLISRPLATSLSIVFDSTSLKSVLSSPSQSKFARPAEAWLSFLWNPMNCKKDLVPKSLPQSALAFYDVIPRNTVPQSVVGLDVTLFLDSMIVRHIQEDPSILSIRSKLSAFERRTFESAQRYFDSDCAETIAVFHVSL
ncbi:hypothetical protein J6590_021697 [Homalodisca vitripennis]|nr:hypothetical protein J6590_021697 [Homalodisca vitripennis]